jgi:hypothetical protein
MSAQQINRLSGRVLVGLSLLALLTVMTGYFQPPEPDEGVGAHIFQLTIVALVPVGLVFLGTADWQRPFKGARTLSLAAILVAAAFAALYYLEHYRYLSPP